MFGRQGVVKPFATVGDYVMDGGFQQNPRVARPAWLFLCLSSPVMLAMSVIPLAKYFGAGCAGTRMASYS